MCNFIINADFDPKSEELGSEKPVTLKFYQDILMTSNKNLLTLVVMTTSEDQPMR